VRACYAILGPADVQVTASEIDLGPLQAAQLRRAQTMSIRDQDHGGVAVAVAVALGGLDQALDLALVQMLATLIDQPWKIMSIARRDWASVGYSM
jgi:hypothetical protein